jgi:hypothetical protein
MMRASPPDAGAGLPTPAGPPGERESFMGYAGRWRLEGDTVLHDVRVSAHPHQVGTEQVRDVVLDGDLLTLYGTRPNGDRPQRRMLRWQRVSPSDTPSNPATPATQATPTTPSDPKE